VGGVDRFELFVGCRLELGVALEAVWVPDFDEHAIGACDFFSTNAGFEAECLQSLAARAKNAFPINRFATYAGIH
jgi:hypothetical protein